VHEVLIPKETMTTEIQSNPVITPTNGSIRLSTIFATTISLLTYD
jgi:hypothetical protein